ncbi:MAG: CRISPR-associated protein [Desulfonauticus sp. 38_4375]|nr:MAG: CRISPR-associated protein [Desulfonauticus sp. 38_4375]
MNILLCLSGLTPQVITESLYALAFKYNPPFIPHQIKVLTTAKGKALIQEKLLHPVEGRFFHLCEEYNLGSIIFDEEDIYVFKGEEELWDLQNSLENSLVADFILQKVKEICLPQENIVYASLSGGRKTMSFYLGMAMQFYAKKTDKLFHVLVNPSFENHPEFFFPSKIDKNIMVYDAEAKKMVVKKSQEAEIKLAEIPFVRLRDKLNWDMDKKLSFKEQVQAVEYSLQQNYCLELDMENTSIVYQDRVVKLTPLEFSIYFVLLDSKKGCNNKECIRCAKCFLNPREFPVENFILILKKIWGNWSLRVENIEKRLTTKDTLSWFLQNKSRINSKINSVFKGKHLEIVGKKNYGSTTYGVFVVKEQVKFKGFKLFSN